MRKTLLIWWLTEGECKAIGERLPKGMPVYIRDQYLSRYGRNGRGRLWIDEQFGDVGIEPWPVSPLGNYLGEWAGGIVMRTRDADWIRQYELPGTLTTTTLQRV